MIKVLWALYGRPSNAPKSEQAIKALPGTIYPLLRTMEREGLIEFRAEVGSWSQAKRYHITPKGLEMIGEVSRD